MKEREKMTAEERERVKLWQQEVEGKKKVRERRWRTEQD